MLKTWTVLVVAALTAGCGITYRQPIYQGNLLDTRNVEQLQPGLTKRQVLLLLGSPSVADPFHADRWDYIASERTGRAGRTQIKNFTLHFEGDTLARWEGEYFAKRDEELAAEMRKFGNLPRERDRDRRRR
ncbi:outer membrane protein assembly factor BamE [Rehaibacterium terrae]|jgi:outer membrane protein assembly factor BamE|uniref:Outer membrane protein assembly factor BamE n=1 Tax=Rehaibacterium terrae TaxID=1341696 RepID=A0A7W7XYZ2_9GAMM|nr:outer membrane protein assembly factor BamE [Rehaibacterium terrae]MBB5015020.1 outer membrane protein assembly factor BamE [Rehaibacterium terrae]